jgi:hypothetical protein
MLPRAGLFLCPQQILAQAPVSMATHFIVSTRCEQRLGAIITVIYEEFRLEEKCDKQFAVVFDAIREMMEPPAVKKQPIGCVHGPDDKSD